MERHCGEHRSLRAHLGVSPRCLDALDAPAVNRHVRNIGDEPMISLQTAHELRRHLGWHAGNFRAQVADQVDVHVLIDCVVGRCPMSDVSVGDEADILEDFEGAVHGRQVDAGRRALDLDEDLLGRSVTQPLHRLKDELTLRGDAEPVLAQASVPVDDHAGGAPSST